MSISRPVSQSHNPTFYSQNKRNDYHVLLQVDSLPHYSLPTAVKLHKLTLSSYSWVVYHPPLNASFQHSPTYREILNTFQENGNNHSAPTLHFTPTFSSPLNYKGRLCTLHFTNDKSEYEENKRTCPR